MFCPRFKYPMDLLWVICSSILTKSISKPNIKNREYFTGYMLAHYDLDCKKYRMNWYLQVQSSTVKWFNTLIISPSAKWINNMWFMCSFTHYYFGKVVLRKAKQCKRQSWKAVWNIMNVLLINARRWWCSDHTVNTCDGGQYRWKSF